MKYVIISVLLFQCVFKDILAQYLECSTREDCIAPTAECQNNLCQCPLKFIYSTDGTECLPIAVGIYAECKDDSQCGWLLGKYKCNNGACNCDEGWRYFEGRCIKTVGLNEPCIQNQDCFNGYDILAMTCSTEGRCVCNEGYYLRGDYDCRPEATTGDYCSLHTDCKSEGTSCISSVCGNTNTKLPISYSRKKISKLLRVYNQDCVNDEDCSALPNSLCYPLTKTCTCKRGYFINSEETRCIAELGIDIGCTTDEECEIIPSRCVNGRCYCRKSYFSVNSNTKCQKPMTHDNLFCNTRERCYVFGTHATCSSNTCRCAANAELDENYICRETGDPQPDICTSDGECQNVLINSVCNDGQCECPNNFHLNDDTCLPNIGTSCDEVTRQCLVENAICDNSICTCKENYVQNGPLTCLPVATGLGSECEINSQCTEIIQNSNCHLDKCECIEGYISINETCHRETYIGDACNNLKECHILLSENVICKNGICQCDLDMIPTKNGIDCEPNSATSLKFSVQILLYVLIICLWS